MSKPLIATHVVTVACRLSGDGATAPDRIMIFPSGGTVRMRDGRVYHIDLAKLAARFAADGLKIPIDVNHATEILAPKGERADPVGFVTAVEVDGPALFGAVEWIDPASAPALLKSYPYISPAFVPTETKEADWLKSVALVSSPALGNQPALAAADPSPQETPMKTVITALGLAETATEAECLAAVTTLKSKTDPSTVVAKGVYDEAVTKLAAATTELDGIKATNRKAKIDAVIEGALQAKKIVPAQRDHYTALCATDEGLAAVEKLLAAAPVLLGDSGLDGKTVPGGDVIQLSAEDKAVMAQLGLTEEAYREANGLKKA